MRRNASSDPTVLGNGFVVGRSSEKPVIWQKHAKKKKKKSFTVFPVYRRGAGCPEPKTAYIVGAITAANSRLLLRCLLVIKLLFGTVNLIYQPNFYPNPINVQRSAWRRNHRCVSSFRPRAVAENDLPIRFIRTLLVVGMKIFSLGNSMSRKIQCKTGNLAIET